MSDFIFSELERKTIIVPAKYSYMRLIAVIARDQLGLDEKLNVTTGEQARRLRKIKPDGKPYDGFGPGRWLVEWDRLLFWYDFLTAYQNMLRPEIVFSAFIPPDVVVISEGPIPGSNVLPISGTWNRLMDTLPRHETKDGPIGKPKNDDPPTRAI